MTTPLINSQITSQSNQFGDTYLYSVNGDTFNTNGATHVFQRQFREGFWLPHCLHIITGSDSGLLIKHLINRGLPKSSTYIFIEPDDLIAPIKQLTPEIDQWPGKIILCKVDELLEYADKIAIDQYIFNNAIHTHQSIAAADGYIAEYKQVTLDINKALKEKSYQVEYIFGEELYTSCHLKNISENRFSAHLLNDCYDGETCIVLGAGPSLEQHLPWIKENREKLTIFAVSRLSHRLINESITPDIIVSADAMDISFDISKEMLLFPTETLFLHAYHVVPSLLSQWHGKSVYLGNRFPWDSKIEDKTVPIAGPTVTNVALFSAAEMGFKRILLAGVDLCFSAQGSSHITGGKEGAMTVSLGFEGSKVTTYAGNEATTDIQMYEATNHLKTQSEIIQKKNAQLFNLSSSAARIEGIPYLSTSEISLDTRNFPPPYTLVPNSSIQNDMADNKRVLTELQHVSKDIEKIITLCKDAIKYNKKIYQRDKEGNYNQKAQRKVSDIQEKIDHKFKYITVLLKTFGVRFFIKFLKPGDQSEWSDEELEENGKDYYQAYLDSSRNFKIKLLDAINRVKNRSEENKSQPSISKLLTQWENDKQYGRALLWKEKHREIFESLNDSQKSSFDVFSKKLLETIHTVETSYSKAWANITNTTDTDKKIYNLAKNKDHLELERIAETLSNENDLKNDKLASHLYYLAKAFYHSCLGQHQQAIKAFELTNQSKLNDDGLKEILSLSIKLNMTDKAEQALKRLSETSYLYTPHYANILKLNNKLNESIQTYTLYLQEYPDDIPTWIALGRLYSDSQETEMANMVFSYVLDRDPDNAIAKEHAPK